MIEKADRSMQDNIVNQRVLQKQLQSKGFIVHVANHGGEALDTLRRSQFWSDNNHPNDSHESSQRDLGTVDTNLNHNDTDKNSSHGNQSTSHNLAEAPRLGDSNISFDSLHTSNPDRLDLHVVLMDQEMPIMDGLECTKVIREWEREAKLSSHVPIIGVTANARQQQIDALINAGMVSKPILLLFTRSLALFTHRPLGTLSASTSRGRTHRKAHTSPYIVPMPNPCRLSMGDPDILIFFQKIFIR
jgi:CheY-like chemotaxis protein